MRKSISLLCAVLFCVLLYMAALIFVYPGTLRPIVVPHTDLYMPLAIANSPFNLHSPRPVGYVLDYLRGSGGLIAAQIFMLAVIAANCALVFFFLLKMNRMWGEGSSLKSIPLLSGFLAYFWLIVTHPNFYIFGGWDAYAQFSFFLLAVAFFVQFFGNDRNPCRRDFTFVLLVTLAFLSKETYALSACLIGSLINALKHWRNSLRPAFAHKAVDALVVVARVPVLITIAFIVAFLLNKALGSPFVGNSDAADGAYRISLDPFSIASEWGRYALDGWSQIVIFGFFLLGLVCVVDLIRGRVLFSIASLVCFLAGVLAWLPNSLLPNHHFSQYSFSGAYLFFAPLIFLIARAASGPQPDRIHTGLMIAAICVFMVSPFFSGDRYAMNSYYLAQAERQNALRETIASIFRAAGEGHLGRRILVAGISSPFNPFDHPAAFLPSSSDSRVSLTIAAYGDDQQQTLRVANESSVIERLHVSKISSRGFDEIMAVGLDGSLLQIKGNEHALIPAQLNGTLDPFLYPELFRVFAAKKDPAYQALDCATVLQSYGAFRESIRCLALSRAALPDNPYVYLYAARAFAKFGFKNAAIELAEKSVFLDAAKSSVFMGTLDSMKSLPDSESGSLGFDAKVLMAEFLE